MDEIQNDRLAEEMPDSTITKFPQPFTLGVPEITILINLKQLTGKSKSALVREAINDLNAKYSARLNATHDAVITDDEN